MKPNSKTLSLFTQSRKIIQSQSNVVAGLKRLSDVIKEIWLFDWKRPGIRTGFQQINSELEPDYMWYSPTETSTCFSILRFAKDWVRSYFEYSTNNIVLIFVDFGAGAGKTNLIAFELGFPVSVAFEIDPQLVEVANHNFANLRYSKNRQRALETFTGDVTNKDHVKELKKVIESHIPSGRQFLLMA